MTTTEDDEKPEV